MRLNPILHDAYEQITYPYPFHQYMVSMARFLFCPDFCSLFFPWRISSLSLFSVMAQAHIHTHTHTHTHTYTHAHMHICTFWDHYSCGRERPLEPRPTSATEASWLESIIHHLRHRLEVREKTEGREACRCDGLSAPADSLGGSPMSIKPGLLGEQ
ncbi:hypothetical protein BP00DRAFT_267525 [Aspergillus indologenus CBS 114.80]|uniref:Uncharacterized protein n=1 Tax=Aspergillus indologenus CBS 114.80 TaxID=1450541 RepID=A0A2V5ILN4_9EURO|nr:hypothetical protein BP00DRAFT_267525 [Aspergillus indologenus CBS 114.80]